ncbi:MAG TPA: leucyl aminopeptidase family protein, partial [Candidatus Paceibacterota bacterium]|nr:leucyl aminopeptidase family protein [Candidatus Paceibacterota bacterium]
KYKSKSRTKNEQKLKEICLCGGLSKAAKAGFAAGQIVANATNATRDIANTSGGDMSPRQLAAAAKAALKGTSVTTQVLGETELKKLKANLLLAVGQGTKEPSQLIVMKYQGATKKAAQPLVLVGKGITYDTGGLNVKPSGAMHDMHLDMSGGAAVIGAMQAIAKLKLKLNVVGIVAAAENSVSAEAMRAGDIFTAMNGKTVEVLHTDAEGRLALADALTYSERFKPKTIVDVATLTGAALVALGQQASAIMTTNDELQRLLVDLGEESGDYVWPLPLWEEYQKPLKSTRADLANIAANFSRFGGTIEGGAFLQNFAPKDVPWVHLDMAPRMESIGSDKLAKGATGEPVRLLVTLAEAMV